MVKYFCDKCGKEVPKEEIKECNLYVKRFRASLREIELSYCKECFEEIIGADNVAKLNKMEVERMERRKAREMK